MCVCVCVCVSLFNCSLVRRLVCLGVLEGGMGVASRVCAGIVLHPL